MRIEKTIFGVPSGLLVGGWPNSRNGRGHKTVATDTDKIAVKVPRDRTGSAPGSMIGTPRGGGVLRLDALALAVRSRKKNSVGRSCATGDESLIQPAALPSPKRISPPMRRRSTPGRYAKTRETFRPNDSDMIPERAWRGEIRT